MITFSFLILLILIYTGFRYKSIIYEKKIEGKNWTLRDLKDYQKISKEKRFDTLLEINCIPKPRLAITHVSRTHLFFPTKRIRIVAFELGADEEVSFWGKSIVGFRNKFVGFQEYPIPVKACLGKITDYDEFTIMNVLHIGNLFGKRNDTLTIISKKNGIEYFFVKK
jgi:hypothetical protein